jgi:hypothetical protein
VNTTKKLALLSLILLISCNPKLTIPVQKDADRGATAFPGLTLDQLKEGKMLFETKCTQCHGTKNPTSWTEAQWRKIIPAMAEKATKSHKKEISKTEQETVLKYVITMRTGAK